MRHLFFIVALLLAEVPFAVFSKSPEAPQVAAITNEGIRYLVPNDKGLRAYVEAWDVKSGKKLWSKTIFRHYYVPPFGNECTHFEFLKSMTLQGGILIVTSDRERVFSLDIRTKSVRRLKEG